MCSTKSAKIASSPQSTFRKRYRYKESLKRASIISLKKKFTNQLMLSTTLLSSAQSLSHPIKFYWVDLSVPVKN
jgi:hypothetical protein